MIVIGVLRFCPDQKGRPAGAERRYGRCRRAIASHHEIGDAIDWSVITTGANAFTVTAAASGHTLVGNMVVAAGKAGLFRTRKTAAATYVTYSLANT